MEVQVLSGGPIKYIKKGRSLTSVFKVLRPCEWETLQKSGTFAGSEHDQRDGFIHLSTKVQVDGVINRYFQDVPEVHLVEFSSNSWNSNQLKWELSSSKNEEFPHLYGTELRKEQVLSEKLVTTRG